MRCDWRVHFGGQQAACDDVLHRAGREPTTAQISDDGTAERPGHRHRGAPFLERVERGFTNRDEPVLVAFARAHHHHTQLFVDIAPAQAGQFTDTEARGIEDLGNRTAAQHRGHNIATGLDEAPNRVFMEHLWQALFALRRAHRTGRVVRAESALAPSEISLYRKETALD